MKRLAAMIALLALAACSGSAAQEATSADTERIAELEAQLEAAVNRAEQAESEAAEAAEDQATSAQQPDDPAPTPEDEAAAEPEPTDPNPGITAIGEPVQYEDGLEVVVTKLQRYAISSTAAGGTPEGPGVIATVKITNNTGEPFDPTLLRATARAGTDGVQVDDVIDFEADIDNRFRGTLPPNRSATATFAFALPKDEQAWNPFAIDIAPSFEHEPITWEGNVKS